MSGDFEGELKRSLPDAGSDALREKALARAEKEALDPFAASLRNLRPAGAGPGFRERVLAAAARERAAARRERFVRYAAAVVVATCAAVNLRVDARPERDGPRQAVSRADAVARDLSAPWMSPYLRLAEAVERHMKRRDINLGDLENRRALAWSEPFSKG